MFPLSFHYEDVSRRGSVAQTESCQRYGSSGSIQNGKAAMEIPRGQRFIQREPQHQVSKSNPFEKDGGSVSDLSRHGSILRGQGMSHFSVRISAVMSLLDSRFANSPGREDHFEIFEHIRGFNVTIVTSANTQDETLSSWSGFFQQDGARED
ncbi:hypothetical protein MKW92_020984 [Papaver armeniacum]|nr:hypothetical protein MKW92_020984 [Papaver armeniacum]